MKTMTATLTGLATATLFAATAQAADTSNMDSAAMTMTSETVRTVKTIDADGEVSMKTVTVMPTETRKTAVMSAFAEQNTDAYIVADADGELFINHLIPVAELPDPTLELDVIDTYTAEYRGMTFTNKVVTEE